MTFRYKTKGDIELEIPNVGVTVDGYITSNTPLENPNLELVEGVVENQQPTPAPAHLNGVVQQNQQPVPVAAPAPEQVVAPAPVQESENV